MLSGADQDGRTHLPGKLELTLTEGPCAGTSYAAKGPCMTVGRTRASKFHIRDPAVSEKHAEISWNGSCWQIRDTGSSNGTALNARELTAEGEGRSRLVPRPGLFALWRC